MSTGRHGASDLGRPHVVGASKTTASATLAVLILLFLPGCRADPSDFRLWNPFHLKLTGGQTEVPVRMGIVFEQKSALDPRRWVEELQAEPWAGLAYDLRRELRRPVQVEPLTVDQIAYHLRSGRLQFALVPGDAIERIRAHRCEFEQLAVARVHQRRGVIVSRADSGIRTFAELRGHRFAFGPKADPVLDVATKAAMEAHGVSVEDLRKEILPVPGTLQYHPNSFEVAKEVIHGGTPAGVLDADEFALMPATGGRFSWRGFRFSRDQFNIIGYTDPVRMDTLEDARFLASLTVDEHTRSAVRARLASLAQREPQALRTLGFQAFQPSP